MYVDQMNKMFCLLLTSTSIRFYLKITRYYDHKVYEVHVQSPQVTSAAFKTQASFKIDMVLGH